MKIKNEKNFQNSMSDYDIVGFSGILRIYDEISPETVVLTSKFLNEMSMMPKAQVSNDNNVSQKTIRVEIMSVGGCIRSGLAVYDMLKNISEEGTPVITVGLGYVASSATIIFSAGDYRYSYPNTEFLIHEPSISQTEGTALELKRQVKQLQAIEKQMVSVYKTVITIPEKELRELIADKEIILNPKQAKKIGLVTDLLK